eukprot:Rhum_TRINITY_DN14044_c0_g1::Rhum_TRINITY_DN14044_c0_g1_i1::g.67905::m.67905
MQATARTAAAAAAAVAPLSRLAASTLVGVRNDGDAALWLKNRYRRESFEDPLDSTSRTRISPATRLLNDHAALVREGCASHKTHCAAVSLLLQGDNVKLAEGIAHIALQRPDTQNDALYVTFMKYYARKGNLVSLHRWWALLVRSGNTGWQTNRGLYTVLFGGFERAKCGPERAERLFNLACLNVKPDVLMLLAYMRTRPSLADARAVRTAHAQVLRAQTAKVTLALLHVCKKVGDAEGAAAVFAKAAAEPHEPPPGPIMWSMLLQAQPSYEGAVAVFKRMASAGVEVLPGCYNYLISKAPSVHEAEALFEAAMQRSVANRMVGSVYVRYLMSHGEEEKVRAVLNRLPGIQYTEEGMKALRQL